MTQPAFNTHPDSVSEGTGQKYGAEHVAYEFRWIYLCNGLWNGFFSRDQLPLVASWVFHKGNHSFASFYWTSIPAYFPTWEASQLKSGSAC